MKSLSLILLSFFLATVPAVAQATTPDGTTQALFQWYQQAGDDYRNDFAAAESYLDPKLYDLLQKGFERTPSDSFWVDFDPFVNAQVSAGSFKFGEPYLTGESAFIRVTPYMEMEGGSPLAMPDIKVYLTQSGGEWRVANLIYTGDNAFELRKYLSDGLARSQSSESMTEQSAGLADALLGTWVHQATSQTADGEARPLTIAVIKWTFKPGGKCDFYQKVGSGKAMEGKDRSYTLEGNTIILGGRTQYTVVKNMGDKMIWRNHRLGDFYHVVRE